MGLHMYLNCEETISDNLENPSENIMENGNWLKLKTFGLSYWRRHPDLHKFIVDNFAGGIDDGKPIDLTLENLHIIINAIVQNNLPKTTGFFFDESENDEAEKTGVIDIFTRAIIWLDTQKTY